MPKILVADDNTNIQKMVSLAFGERGIDVVSVGNGEAAVRRLPELHPDLVLADIFMPVRNGYEVCEYVKRDPRLSHIPVILLVGAFDPLDEKEAHRVGADGVLKKPFVPPDPLIAMVTSVLEKNPKVAAELAAARKPAPAPVAPAQPAVRPASEIPNRVIAKAPPTPVQEFPEPSPEEAALIYGFGSGQRTLDPDKIPSEPLVPTEDTEAFDGAATASDWRRSARNFEVPEETSKKASFVDEQLNSAPAAAAQIASHGVPKSEVPVEIQTAGQEQPEFEVPGAVEGPSAQWVSSIPPETAEPEIGVHEATVGTIDSTNASQSPASEQTFIVGEESEPESARAIEIAEAEPQAEIHQEQVVQAESELQVPESSVGENSLAREPSLASKAAGWIEAIFPSKYPKGGWFSSITTKKEHAEGSQSGEIAPVPESHEDTPSHFEPQQPHESVLASDLKIDAVADADSEVVHISREAAENAPVVATGEEEEESFFAEEPEASQPEAAAAFILPAEQHAVETASEPKAVEPPVEESVSLPESLFAVERAPAASLWPLPMISPIFSKSEPELIEPPPVAGKTDPLLVNEDSRGKSDYGRQSEEIPALHSFLAPTSPAPTQTEAAISASSPFELPTSAAEGSVEEQTAASKSEQVWAEPVVAEDARVEAEEESGWIPTGPPPSREALSEIPFLSPPILSADESSPVLQHASADPVNSVSPEVLDAVVRKVLERIEPQLHEFLAKGLVKPIVEGILESEVGKKGS